MRKKTLVPLLLLTPFITGAPTEERLSSDGVLELLNSTVTKNSKQEVPLSKNASETSMTSQPPQITLPVTSSNTPLLLPRPFFIPFLFPLPSLHPSSNFQFAATSKPLKNDEGDLEEEETEGLILPVETPFDSMPEARRTPNSNRRNSRKKKQKKPKKPKPPQPLVIYQNQEERPGVPGVQEPQSSHLGYYMFYAIGVRWTGNNTTHPVVTGRPFPGAILIPPATGVVDSLSETIVPADLIDGGRQQTTPAR